MKTKNSLIPAFMIVFLLMVSLNISADSWSVNREKDHKQPKADGCYSYMEKYDCYYIDKKADENDKVIYLTFDAGYENGNIEKILDTLRKHNAKGAFFVLKNLIVRNTDLVKRMTDEGHLVCNHTANHPDMTRYKDIEAFKSELTALENVYTEHTGLTLSKYFRPPEGKFDEQTLSFAKSLGYKTIFWSFAYADWDNNNQPSLDYAFQKITENTHNGMIALLHPTSSANAAVLDRILSYWEKEGYRFGTLDELTEK